MKVRPRRVRFALIGLGLLAALGFVYAIPSNPNGNGPCARPTVGRPISELVKPARHRCPDRAGLPAAGHLRGTRPVHDGSSAGRPEVAPQPTTRRMTGNARLTAPGTE